MTGRVCVGAVVGYYDSTNTLPLTGCAMVGGSVNGIGDSDGIEVASTTGGVVGRADGGISNCYSTGSVSGKSYVGGVAGQANGGVSNCYATGSVSGQSYIGGVVGLTDGSVASCVALNRAVTASVSSARRIANKNGDSVTIADCYAWSGMTVKEGGSIITPTPTGVATEHGADLTYTASGLSPKGFSEIFGNNIAWNYHTEARNTRPTLNNVGGTQPHYLPSWMTANDDVIYISTAAELALLADEVNGTVPDPDHPGQNKTEDNKSGKQYYLTNDIDLSAYKTADSGEGWTPIGKYVDGEESGKDWPFAGKFFGQGHTVRNLTINRQGLAANGRSQGLFGYVEGTAEHPALVKDLIVENASITSYQIIGAVVGYYGSHTDALTNCAMVGGSVEGTGGQSESIGGVAGTVKSSITRCYATGSVEGKKMVGGVVGSAMDVSNCYATGEVRGNYYNDLNPLSNCLVGGVAGKVENTIASCYATGNVICDSMFTDVGGVAGSVGGNVTNCVALGRVVSGGTKNLGRVAGIVGGSDSVSGAYARKDMTVNGSTVNGGLSTNKQGADLSASAGWLLDGTSKFTWPGFTAANGWSGVNETAYKLPYLTGTLGRPALSLGQSTDIRSAITLDSSSGSGGTASVEAVLGAPMPDVTPPTRDGYTFAGYFDAAAGGTQYYDANGKSVHDWDTNANTLYAHWTANPTPPAPPAPSGGGSAMAGVSYTGNSYAGAWSLDGVLTVQAPCERLVSVVADGAMLSKNTDFTVGCGSTIITFTPAYLATLKNGAHTLRVQFTDGQYTGTFVTPLGIAAAGVAEVPATGGISCAWAVLLLAAGLAALLRRRARVRGLPFI